MRIKTSPCRARTVSFGSCLRSGVRGAGVRVNKGREVAAGWLPEQQPTLVVTDHSHSLRPRAPPSTQVSTRDDLPGLEPHRGSVADLTQPQGPPVNANGHD